MVPLRNIRRFFYKGRRQPSYALRVLRRRVLSYFYYRFWKGRSYYPEAITLFLTHRCNLHCNMCGQWGESGITKKKSTQYIKEELSVDLLKGVIEDLSKFRPNITLFGGEPLLHPGCLKIIKFVKQKNMHCLMITNGSLLSDTAEGIVEAGLDELNVSLDGGEALHDEIRGMSGLFAKITGGLKKINHLKRKMKKKRPLINLQCTITKYNYKNLEQMLEVARQIEADFLTFHNLIFLSKDVMDRQKEYDRLLNFSSYDWEGFVFEPQIDPVILHSKFRQILTRKSQFPIDFYPNFSLEGLKEYYQNTSFSVSEYPARCISPWMTAYIFPDGNLRPCLNFDYSYGNIKREKFISLWNNQLARRFRKALKENRIFSVCARCTELYRY